MDEIKAGDIVTLKSGSQGMTVGYVTNDGKKADLYWMDNKGEHHNATYPIAALKKA